MARRSRRITGANRLRRKLRRFPDEATDELRQTIWAFASEMQGDARARAPKDTGTLAANIQARFSRDGLEARVGVITKAAKRKAYYAGFVEFGTRNMPARPWLVPALEQNRPKFRPQINSAVDRAVRRVARMAASDG